MAADPIGPERAALVPYPDVASIDPSGSEPSGRPGPARCAWAEGVGGIGRSLYGVLGHPYSALSVECPMHKMLICICFPSAVRQAPLFDRILVLCVGNICRSPMAECLLKHAFSVHGRPSEVRSAGLGAVVGHPADDHVLTLMRRRGLDLSEHRAVQVNREMLRWAQLVLIMEKSHRAHLRILDPAVSGKVMLLGHWTGWEVSDPHQRTLDVFEQTEGLIDSAVDSWMERL